MDFYKAALLIVFQKSGQTLLDLLPYVIMGVIIGEALKLTSWTKLIYKSISKSPFLSLITASMLGILSPLCTYGTIPVVLQLFKGGIPIAPLLAFLASSSMMNPQLFIITWGGIGLEMAVVRTLCVFLFSLLVGLILMRLPQSWAVNPQVLSSRETGEEILNRPPKTFCFKSFAKNITESLQFVGFYMVVGVVIGVCVEVLIPARWIQMIFQPGHWLSVLAAALMGIPLYACGGGVIPLVRSLMAQGMSRGAALAFFIVGPATRVTSLIALAAILRPLFIAAYILALLAFSILVGMVY